MSNNDIWIDIKTIAEIKEITPRALRLALKRDKYTFREVKIQKKKSYEILLSSLLPVPAPSAGLEGGLSGT